MLSRGATDSVDANRDRAAKSHELCKLRLYGRQVSAALAELDRSQSPDNVEDARRHCRELRLVLLELNPSATIPFHCDQPLCSVLRSPRTTCWIRHFQDLIQGPLALEPSANDAICARVPLPAQIRQEPDRSHFRKEPDRPVVRETLSDLRHAIELLGLELAYLQYYYFDVQLQILSLPSLFP